MAESPVPPDSGERPEDDDFDWSHFSCPECGSCGVAGCLCGSECERNAGCRFPDLWEETKAEIREGSSSIGYKTETAAEVLARMEATERG